MAHFKRHNSCYISLRTLSAWVRNPILRLTGLNRYFKNTQPHNQRPTKVVLLPPSFVFFPLNASTSDAINVIRIFRVSWASSENLFWKTNTPDSWHQDSRFLVSDPRWVASFDTKIKMIRWDGWCCGGASGRVWPASVRIPCRTLSFLVQTVFLVSRTTAHA